MTMLAGALALGRGHASTLFTETLQFFAHGAVTINPETLAETATDTVLFTVPGRIKFLSMNSLTPTEVETSGQVIAVQNTFAVVAVGSTPDVAADHFVRVTASTADSTLVGRVFRVTGLPQSGQVTAHRYPIEEMS